MVGVVGVVVGGVGQCSRHSTCGGRIEDDSVCPLWLTNPSQYRHVSIDYREQKNVDRVLVAKHRFAIDAVIQCFSYPKVHGLA